ncbi:hypothetical protein ACHAWO_005275 [Cyclotella atomus]|uniref:RING-type domain-containing protein n=1 Tax=Cyclotella atomus TaxID=382360 RepID=A0ABD3NF30_9STRA
MTDEEISCPICLSSSKDSSSTQFAKTVCGHIFCTACLTHVLCKPRKIYEDEDDVRKICITRGKCPMCRGHINLFELRDTTNPDACAVEKNTDVKSWPIFGQAYLQKPLGRVSSRRESLMERLAKEDGPMKGFGIEFNFCSDVPAMKFAVPIYTYSFESTEHECLHELKFDDFHFHKDTMTFHGKCRAADSRPWTQMYPKNDLANEPMPAYFYERLECMLQFSPDGRYIRDGYKSWSLYDTSLLKRYPLDGTWECNVSREAYTMHVQCHSSTYFNQRGLFDISDNKVSYRLDGSEPQVAVQEILPGSNAAIGDVLSFESPPLPVWKWTRVSLDLKDASSVVRMKPLSSNVAPGSRFVYQRVINDPCNNDTLGPSYHSDSVWGNTFCQAFTVGLASYHFVKSEENDGEYQAYISYENPKTSQWPDLDNGQPIPPRVSFRNIQWDEHTRTFKGDILWVQDFGSTWTGDSKWTYEMVFDPTFKFIASGSCTMSNREPHIFGDSLVYINAALEHIFSEALRSASTEDYLGIIRECRDNGASPPTLQCLGEVALSVMYGEEESCFDFNL